MIRITTKTKGPSMLKWLNDIRDWNAKRILNKYGALGVEALAEATPRKTGKTAESWSYDVEETDGRYTINWHNSNVNNYVNIALILQFGHGTGTGGWVEGVDYINPALKPIFDKFADEAYLEITAKKK